MQRYFLASIAALTLAGCATGPGYTQASVVYAAPAQYVYVVPVDHVVVVTREVLVNRGWTVFRVEHDGPNRIVWARRGEEVVRIFATPEGERGERVAVRGIREVREVHEDRGRHEGWANRGEPKEIITDIDVKLR